VILPSDSDACGFVLVIKRKADISAQVVIFQFLSNLVAFVNLILKKMMMMMMMMMMMTFFLK